LASDYVVKIDFTTHVEAFEKRGRGQIEYALSPTYFFQKHQQAHHGESEKEPVEVARLIPDSDHNGKRNDAYQQEADGRYPFDDVIVVQDNVVAIYVGEI
jgi:hypothetical protein